MKASRSRSVESIAAPAPNRRRNSRRLAVVLLVLTALLAGCSAGSGSAPQSSGSAAKALTIGLTYTPDIQFAPFYVGVEKGFFADEGLHVTLRHHGASESLTGALQAGEENVVYAGGDEMMVSRSQGVDVVSFATLYQTYPAELIVPADSPITRPEDLKGHSVGLPGEYGQNWYALLALLKQAGLSRSDVNIQSIGFTQQAALTSHKVDSVLGFSNNDAVKFRQAGFAIREIRLAPDAALVGAGLGASAATVKDRRADLQALIRGLARSIAYCRTNPDDTVAIAAKYVPTLSTQAQKDAAKAVLEATNSLYGDNIGQQDPQRWSDMSAFLLASGIMTRAVQPGDAFTSLAP
ncbi:NitT/TauT family transport system substrate-binding protein [Propionibacterium cyclohexanicum]|uniref:NitT/TauT family transport system substrate-binding protein n=1 Tax=Propionibacterium cyclohexanicum TaxID=64702 RepID=A0A1H9TFQ2_9ACTN|nr:ABC transporter substrate-binding protein [Propionibacterium cyclohexanicum]SER95784.1 NitT/TauT family transport system substrate-binding protein [Propionibacterium cyclohexanicum]